MMGFAMSFMELQNWIFGCSALVFALPVLPVCLPSARRWFAAVGTLRSAKKSSSGCLGVTTQVLAWVTSVLIGFVVLIALLAGCASSRNAKDSALAPGVVATTENCDMIFLGVDLRQIPQWDRLVTGSALTEKGCKPFRYRTKEVKLASPFMGINDALFSVSDQIQL